MLFSPTLGLLGIGIIALCLVVRRVRRHSISHLPGPASSSWFVGNLPSFERTQSAGEADFEWSQKYGLAFRTKGCFGEDRLFLADPKGLQYILNKSGYRYPKTFESRNRQQLSTGRGIVWADGEQHARHRKIMNPAFSYSALKDFLPLFFDIAQKACTPRLHEEATKSSLFDLTHWLARTTLDVIGAAAFGYQFNLVEGAETELYKAYHNLYIDSHFMISDFTIVFRRITSFAPMWLTKYLLHLPKKDVRRMKRCADLNFKLGRELLVREKEAHERGKEGGKDVMSLFVKANGSEDPRRRLGEDEVLSQIMTLTFAGFETTATTLTWIFYELSRHAGVQDKLRREIKSTRANMTARGDKELTIADLESMKYTVAETLRFHPIVVHLFRMAGQDDVIPLEWPQRTISGEMVTEIPVSKGQVIMLSLWTYNRLKTLWGEDADQWKPERFLQDLSSEHKTNVGVYGNLATFSSGLRSCIGYVLLEMQAILIELVENFDFGPAPGNVEITRRVAAIVQPMVKGRENAGAQMPLTVTAINET
ncbi:PAH-inducible cytochrome P450 monooxygenase PC-PAH 4 [Ramaria rubella]|nr:PAH-inducible cytochrome P450 monooxygenase PC-PAH 4 [Ramaria rubella]